MHQNRRANRGHCLLGQWTLWFCYSNYTQGCLFKVGQLIVFRYILVRATYQEDSLTQTKVILTSEFADVILIAYS